MINDGGVMALILLILGLIAGFATGFLIKNALAKTGKTTGPHEAQLQLQIDALLKDISSHNHNVEKLRGEISTLRKENAKRRKENDRLFDENIELTSENNELQIAYKKEQERRAKGKAYYADNDVSDFQNQLKFVSQVELRAVKPVNGEAVRVLYFLEKWIRDNQPEWRISFEVAMGSFVSTAYGVGNKLFEAAFKSYNSKRVDFLIVDRCGCPRLVVEYNGSGHYISENADGRMKVKKLVLERAGIPLVEIPENTSDREMLRLISEGFEPQ